MPKVSTDHIVARKEEILNSARTAFTLYGYDGASVRKIEEATGLSRGTIFHHFKDKDALFLALAHTDTLTMADVVAQAGLVQVMRNIIANPHQYAWLGIRLEISRKLRSDPEFKKQWSHLTEELTQVARERLESRRLQGKLRSDIPTDVLAEFLELFLDGLITRISQGIHASELARLSAVVDLVEASVRPSLP